MSGYRTRADVKSFSDRCLHVESSSGITDYMQEYKRPTTNEEDNKDTPHEYYYCIYIIYIHTVTYILESRYYNIRKGGETVTSKAHIVTQQGVVRRRGGAVVLYPTTYI
jgi:hypothetical protein